MAQKIKSAQIETQEVWTALPMSNSWVNYDPAFDYAEYMKDSLGFVHVKGFIKSGSTSSGAVIGTLPAGYRPAQGTYCAGASSPGSTLAVVHLNANGQIKFVAGNNTYLSFGHIVFKAEG